MTDSQTEADQTEESEDFTWRVTMSRSEEGKPEVALEFGAELTEFPADDETKVCIIGKSLIQLGTRFMGASVGEGED